MPLPENWVGIFYSAEAYGDMIFDLSPQEFVDTLREHRPDEVKFFTAGAIFDLLLNGRRDLAIEFIEVARGYWPEPDPTSSWSMLPILLSLAKELMLVGVPGDKVKLAVANMVSEWFDGGLVVHIYEPQSPLVEINPN